MSEVLILEEKQEIKSLLFSQFIVESATVTSCLVACLRPVSGKVKFCVSHQANWPRRKKRKKQCSYRFTPNCFLISLHSICNQRSQLNIQLGRCAMGAIFPDAKYENNASSQCQDLSNLTVLTVLNLQFHNCQVITAPLTVRMVYNKLTGPYLPQ